MDPVVKEWAEFASYIASIVMGLAAVAALQQVVLLKKDMRLRNQRAAAEKAIEAVDQYAAFANEALVFFKELRAADVPTYSGPIGDFTPASVPAEWEPTAKKRVAITSWISAVNTLDAIAASFIFGVADEATGFAMIGRSFCANVGHFYDLMARQRKDAVQPHFQGVVDLYSLWSSRLSREQLANSRKALDAQIANLPDRKITPIGVDD